MSDDLIRSFLTLGSAVYIVDRHISSEALSYIHEHRDKIQRVDGSVSTRDFFSSAWDLNVDKTSPKIGDRHLFVIDRRSGNRYINDSAGNIRLDLFCRMVIGEYFFAPFFNALFKAVKFVSGYHFWKAKEGDYNFTARIADAGKDLLRIVATPLTMLVSWWYMFIGLFSPDTGRKGLSAVERLSAGDDTFFINELFQPYEIVGDKALPQKDVVELTSLAKASSM